MGYVGDVDDEQQRRWMLIQEIFQVLDKKQRGFLSRTELAHMLDALQQDPTSSFPKVDITPSEKDKRLSLSDVQTLLHAFTISNLDDLKWFAESVVKVEAELRDVWKRAVLTWQGKVEVLYKRNLHRYLLTTQPDRVSRWLLLRTSSAKERQYGEACTGLLGLGISQPEVEVLFTNDTADDIKKCATLIDPFLECLHNFDELMRMLTEEITTIPMYAEHESRIVELLSALVGWAKSRDLACLMMHENCLNVLTMMVCSAIFNQAVVTEASEVIVALMDHRIHEDNHDYEEICRTNFMEWLDVGYNVRSDDSVVTVTRPVPTLPRALLEAERNKDKSGRTCAEWVGALLTLEADFDRGETLDMIIKYDEKRVLTKEEGGVLSNEDEPSVLHRSLFSYGQTVPIILSRLDVSSHHSLHEHRTPLRTHMLKLLLNVLTGCDKYGQNLFRKGEGMRVLCILIRGNSWGAEREEISMEEEIDRDEEDELYRARQWIWQEPYQSWPYVESEKSFQNQRYYNVDFLDDKFYGSKDRHLAAAFLEHMATPTMWGVDGLVIEMMDYRYTLQTLCRSRPPLCSLIKLLLQSPLFPSFLRAQCAREIAQTYAEKAIAPVHMPDGTCHSLFPVLYSGKDAMEALARFQRWVVEVETKNVVLRILAHCFHSLQTYLSEERTTREDREGKGGSGPALQDEDAEDEATQIEEDIQECCRLLSKQLPLQEAGIHVANIAVAIYLQVKSFTRKALLSVNALPHVNPDERQKARSLEVAKTIPPRPMYFGHYQQLIYNQSNPTQPSSREMVSDYQAQLKCLQGAADILFTGENRFLSEPSLFPYEFLIVLRIIQLLRLRQSVPTFVVELQEILEQLTGQRSFFVFSDAQDDIELAGADYPWRTGLSTLNTFRISQVPLRQSHLRHFPRQSPTTVTRGVISVLKEYSELPLWEEEEETQRPPTEKQVLDAAANRRSVLLALMFNHLCFYHPKSCTIEDSSTGLAMRLGVNLEVLEQVVRITSEPLWEEAPEVRIVRPQGNLVLAFITIPSVDNKQEASPSPSAPQRLAFVFMEEYWVLWANCVKDHSLVLTECGAVIKYFDFSPTQEGST
eukprot:GEMP01004743.1.p1 GENE.GEMP01004743.1~~GEMP01004743.1.p1  ORF type:complete len:1107 (+),score=283.04 GEMP01004743.1:49-3321(+)